MNSCLLLGSNLGDRNALLAQAQAQIEQNCGHLIKVSKIYETAPWGFKADTPFLNQALLINTTLPPEELITRCLEIETLMGRMRIPDKQPYSSRTIDIDILFYEETVCQSPHLTLPHPLLPARLFALQPMAEVAPEWVHPVLGLTADEMIRRLP